MAFFAGVVLVVYMATNVLNFLLVARCPRARDGVRR